MRLLAVFPYALMHETRLVFYLGLLSMVAGVDLVDARTNPTFCLRNRVGSL